MNSVIERYTNLNEIYFTKNYFVIYFANLVNQFPRWLIRISYINKVQKFLKVSGVDLWRGCILIEIFIEMIVHLHAVVRCICF